MFWICIDGRFPFSLWIVKGRFVLRLRFCLKILLHNFVLMGHSQSAPQLILLEFAHQLIQLVLAISITPFLRMIRISRFVSHRIQAVQPLALLALHYLSLGVFEPRAVTPFD